MLVAVVAGEGTDDLVIRRPAAVVAVAGENCGVGFASDDVTDDLHSSHADDTTDDIVELEVHEDERFLREHAHDNDFVVFTHDLDFGTLLAMTRSVGPSVIQVRTQNVMPDGIGSLVVDALTQHREALDQGGSLELDDCPAAESQVVDMERPLKFDFRVQRFSLIAFPFVECGADETVAEKGSIDG